MLLQNVKFLGGFVEILFCVCDARHLEYSIVEVNVISLMCLGFFKI